MRGVLSSDVAARSRTNPSRQTRPHCRLIPLYLRKFQREGFLEDGGTTVTVACAVGARRFNDIHIAAVNWPKGVSLFKLIPTEDGLYCFKSAKDRLHGWVRGTLCWPDGQRGVQVIDTSEDQRIQVLVANADGELSWCKFQHHSLNRVSPCNAGFVENTAMLMSDFELWSRARDAAPGATVPRSHILVRGTDTTHAVFGADHIGSRGERSVQLVFVDIHDSGRAKAMAMIPISPLTFAPSDVLVGMVWRTEGCYAFAFVGYKFISLLDAPAEFPPTHGGLCQRVQFLHAVGSQLEEKAFVSYRIHGSSNYDEGAVLAVHRRSLDEVTDEDCCVVAQKWGDAGFFVYASRARRTSDHQFSFINASREDWFLSGVSTLIAERNAFPYRSDGVSDRLWVVHATKPVLMLYFEHDEPGSGQAYPARVWDSAGVWADSDADVCLVILARYDEGPQMHCLYDEFFVGGRRPSAPREWGVRE